MRIGQLYYYYYMTINYLKIYRKVAPKIRVQVVGSSFAYKLVKNIIAKFLKDFSRQFRKSSISWICLAKYIYIYIFLN